MTANNYLALVISPQHRRTHGPLHEYYYPFDSRDMRSITRAQGAAEAKRRNIEFFGVDVVLAVWRHCEMIDAPVIGDSWIISRIPQTRAHRWNPTGRIGETTAPKTHKAGETWRGSGGGRIGEATQPKRVRDACLPTAERDGLCDDTLMRAFENLYVSAQDNGFPEGVEVES